MAAWQGHVMSCLSCQFMVMMVDEGIDFCLSWKESALNFAVDRDGGTEFQAVISCPSHVSGWSRERNRVAGKVKISFLHTDKKKIQWEERRKEENINSYSEG